MLTDKRKIIIALMVAMLSHPPIISARQVGGMTFSLMSYTMTLSQNEHNIFTAILDIGIRSCYNQDN